MTQVVVHDWLPGTGKDGDFIVYQGILDGVVVYVGMGSEDRHLHLNSGVSHLYEANRAHFSGQDIVVEVIQSGLTKEKALQLEKSLIKEKQPGWNSTYTEVARIKRSMNRSLSKYSSIENKSTNLKILLLSLGKVDAEYSFILENKIFMSSVGFSLALWASNFKSAKTPHKFVDSIQKIRSGVYRVTFNKYFIDNMEVTLSCLRLSNG